MTPVNQCLIKVDHAFARLDSAVGEHVRAALAELEGAYRRPSERIVALEAVLHEFHQRRRNGAGSSFGRFLRITVERRQNKWARLV